MQALSQNAETRMNLVKQFAQIMAKEEVMKEMYSIIANPALKPTVNRDYNPQTFEQLKEKYDQILSSVRDLIKERNAIFLNIDAGLEELEKEKIAASSANERYDVKASCLLPFIVLQ